MLFENIFVFSPDKYLNYKILVHSRNFGFDLYYQKKQWVNHLNSLMWTSLFIYVFIASLNIKYINVYNKEILVLRVQLSFHFCSQESIVSNWEVSSFLAILKIGLLDRSLFLRALTVSWCMGKGVLSSIRL